MFAGKKSAQIREILISESAWEEMTCLFAPSLAGDHYKWRAMRANGIAERYITGDATAEENFKAWAETVESSFGNPLYHWTHLELNKYFSCNEMLSSENWQEIMQHCNQQMAGEDFKPRSLIARSNVEVICTTDAPLDSLEYHRLLQQDSTFKTRVLPTFRPDDVFEPDANRFACFVDKLAALTGREICTFADFSAALAQRIDWFHESGCRISDHGPVILEYQAADEQRVNGLFSQKRGGEALTGLESAQLTSAIFVMLAKEYKQRGWAMQIHFGAIRSNNSKMHQQLNSCA